MTSSATSPMKRTGKSRKSDETKRKLIEAAASGFARYGFERTSGDEIARMAGVNKQLIYQYFGSKDELFRVVLREAYMRYRGDEELIMAAVACPDARDALRNLAKFLFGRTPELVQFQRLILDANLRGIEAIIGIGEVKPAYDRLLEIVQSILDRGKEQGVFIEGIDAREFYMTMCGACGSRITNALTLSAVLGVDLLNDTAAARSQELAMDLLIRGISASPTKSS